MELSEDEKYLASLYKDHPKELIDSYVEVYRANQEFLAIIQGYHEQSGYLDKCTTPSDVADAVVSFLLTTLRECNKYTHEQAPNVPGISAFLDALHKEYRQGGATNNISFIDKPEEEIPDGPDTIASGSD